MSHPKPTPHTEEEIAKIKEEVSLLPSYENGFIYYPDFRKLMFDILKWDMSVESIEFLIEFARVEKNGALHWDELEKYVRTCHDTVLYAGEIVKNFDSNKDGFISVDEFERIFKYLRVFDPKLKEVSYENFVAEADLNEDGKITVQEAQAWVEKKINP